MTVRRRCPAALVVMLIQMFPAVLAHHWLISGVAAGGVKG